MRRVSDTLRKAIPAKHASNSNAPVHYREASTLVIECRSCNPRPDLLEDHCLLCVIRILSQQTGVSKILLCGEIDASYEGTSLVVLKDLAELRRSCEESRTRVPRDKGCSECSLDPHAVFGPLSDPRQRDRAKAEVERFRCLNPSNRVCRDCIAQTRSALEEMAARMRSMERTIARKTFLVVEAGKDA